MLSCNQVLARHSEYMDGVMAFAEAEELRAHLSACTSCAHYDSVVRRGVQLLAARPVQAPDPDFLRSLHTRLAFEDERAALRPITIAASASVSVAALLALAAWLPMLFGSDHPSARALQAALPADVTSSEIAWHTATAVTDQAEHSEATEPDVTLTANNADVSMIDRGYSPLILENPTAPPSYLHASFTSLETR